MFPMAAERLPGVLVAPTTTIGAAMAQLDRAGTGVLIMADEAGSLLGVVSDGDIRRAILAGAPLERHCGEIANRAPLTIGPSADAAEVLAAMDSARGSFVNSLVVVDATGTVLGLVLRRDVSDERAPLSAVIMAGGYGKRLLPLTENTPKPMLQVGDRPLLQRTIEGLHASGIRSVAITTHHLAERITEYFGDGAGFGMDLSYVCEDAPLGTAGALRLLEDSDAPLLVLNGDILSGVHYRDMLAYHRDQDAALTVGVRRCTLEVPYGVVENDGAMITGIREKPRMEFFINAGVYMLEPSARRRIPAGVRFDMTDLVAQLLADGARVASFPILEYWLDIGRPDDYAQAQEDVRMARL